MNGTFRQALATRNVILTFGITPPRSSVTRDEADRIAAATLGRLSGLDLDALVVYDLVDESERTDAERPFPFTHTMDPVTYLRDHLSGWDKPSVIYRSVARHTEDELAGWLRELPASEGAVFVGAPSRDSEVKTTLPAAQALHAQVRPDLPLGGVAIPERHMGRHDEHERLLAKQERGVSYFITQVVYDVTAAKNMASDYLYAALDRGVEPARMIFTLTLCGSLRTLQFLEWLGVQVPAWVRNDLVHSRDLLSPSLMHALSTARELRDFCDHLGLPCGFNIESVSNRKVEIEAAVHLTRQLAFEMRTP